VAVVDEQNRVHLKHIDIILDTGTDVEIASGITATDRIVASPSDSIADGDEVKIAGIDGKAIDKNISARAVPGVTE
jgi:hypothetical protein